MKLTTLRERIDFAWAAEAPGCANPSPNIVSSDTSVIIMSVAVPPQYCKCDEVLSIFAADKCAFSHPVQPLMDRYRRFTGASAPELDGFHKSLQQITERVAAAWTDAGSLGLERDAARLAVLLKSFSKAAAAQVKGPGLKLKRHILLPPRQNLRLDTARGSSLKVYLRGLAAIPLA